MPLGKKDLQTLKESKARKGLKYLGFVTTQVGTKKQGHRGTKENENM